MKNKGIKEEEKIARELGGIPTPRSGGGSIKGDVFATLNGTKYSIQSKYTDNNSFTLKLSDLDKSIEEGLIHGRETIFIITFKNRRFWVLSEYQAKQLIEGEGE